MEPTEIFELAGNGFQFKVNIPFKRISFENGGVTYYIGTTTFEPMNGEQQVDEAAAAFIQMPEVLIELADILVRTAGSKIGLDRARELLDKLMFQRPSEPLQSL